MISSEAKGVIFQTLAIAVAFYIFTASLHFIFVPVLDQKENFCVPGNYYEDGNQCYKFVSEREESIWYHNSRMHSRSVAINVSFFVLTWILMMFLTNRSDPRIKWEDVFVFAFLLAVLGMLMGQTVYLNFPPPYGWWPDVLREVHSAHILYALRFL